MSRALASTLALLAVLIAAAPAGAAVKAKFGKSVVLTPVSGSVLVKEPGERTRKVRAKTAISLGSKVDTRNGKVKLTSQLRKGKQQSARFKGAPFRVTQPRDEGGLTDLELTAKLQCGPGSAKGARRSRLFGSGKGRFRTRGRNSSATVRGTTWVTEDDCTGTQITSVEGEVQTDAEGADLERLLEPGQSVSYYCEIRNRTTDGKGTFCILLLSQPKDRLFGMGITALTDETSYVLCLRYPAGSGVPDECVELPLSEPDPEYGFRGSAVACFSRAGEGVYTAQWALAGELLEPPLHSVRLRGADASYPPCLIEPPPQPPAKRAQGRDGEGSLTGSFGAGFPGLVPAL
jgi:hypothetical protein